MSHRKLGRIPANRAPNSTAVRPGEFVEVPPPPVTFPMLSEDNDHLRAYRFGECSVLVTREFGKWHMSIAHPRRYPTWLEISAAWYGVVPGARDLTGAIILPPLHEYVNMHEFCMHVNQIDDLGD